MLLYFTAVFIVNVHCTLSVVSFPATTYVNVCFSDGKQKLDSPVWGCYPLSWCESWLHVVSYIWQSEKKEKNVMNG